MLNTLRRELKGEEVDYPFLMSFLQDYAKPRDKITRLLRKGDLIRVKKGLYILGNTYRKGPVSLEILANLIYGPSYLSLEYALSFYGLIPEKVEALTSMTTHKNKTFRTPIGLFTYHHLNPKRYAIGVTQYQVGEDRYFLIGYPEKALADKVAQENLNSKQAMFEYLTQDLRIDPVMLRDLNYTRLKAIAKAYEHTSVSLLASCIKELL